MTEETPIMELIPCNIEDLSPKPEDRQKEMAKSKKQKAIEWGRPGHLTETEVQVFVSSYLLLLDAC